MALALRHSAGSRFSAWPLTLELAESRSNSFKWQLEAIGKVRDSKIEACKHYDFQNLIIVEMLAQ